VSRQATNQQQYIGSLPCLNTQANWDGKTNIEYTLDNFRDLALHFAIHSSFWSAYQVVGTRIIFLIRFYIL
jgi:hypothetical protein